MNSLKDEAYNSHGHMHMHCTIHGPSCALQRGAKRHMACQIEWGKQVGPPANNWKTFWKAKAAQELGEDYQRRDHDKTQLRAIGHTAAQNTSSHHTDTVLHTLCVISTTSSC